MTYHYCYDEAAKTKAHRIDRALLLKVAQAMNLRPQDYELRSNRGGIAVWGEVTLHTDTIYIQVTRGNDAGVLVRSCKGRKDYTGGVNRFLPYALLKANAADFAVRAVEVTHGAESLRRHARLWLWSLRPGGAALGVDESQTKS